MKKIVFILGILAVIIYFIAPDPAYAQATRTWVSGVGDDANPCSRTAPCKTFAGAISKTAAGGEINVLDPGGFGAVTITKSITIDGSGGSIAGVLVSGTNGIVISAGASDAVNLRNLDIDGLNTGLAGIKFLAGGSLTVENVHVYEFTGVGIDFEPNQATNSQLYVRNSFSERNGGGVLIKPAGGGTATASLVRVEMYKNVFGVRAEDRANVTIDDSIASANSGQGFIAVNVSAATTMFLENSVATGNGNGSNSAGVRADGTLTTVRISNNVITNNTNNGILATTSAQIISFGNNKNAGNVTNGAPTSTIGQQ